MSDKFNDENDEEKKEDFSNPANISKNEVQYIEFDESEKFKEDASKLFEILNQLYNKNQNLFKDPTADIYEDFLQLFQPGKNAKERGNTGDVIVSAVKKIVSDLSNKQNRINAATQPKVKQIDGLLYTTLQDAKTTSFWSLSELEMLLSRHVINNASFKRYNIQFSLTSPRTYAERKKLKGVGRIIVHLSTTPYEIWNSGLMHNLLKELIKVPFVTALKVRNMRDLDRADSMLIYTTIPPETAWQELKNIITSAIPKKYRSDYTLPFSTPLDLGINANIPINYTNPDDNTKKLVSFTDGIAKLGRQAYLRYLNMNVVSESDKLPIFIQILGAHFQFNNLKITKDGVLCQPEPPISKKT